MPTGGFGRSPKPDRTVNHWGPKTDNLKEKGRISRLIFGGAIALLSRRSNVLSATM
jgi:hypothetical protein